MSLLKNRKDDVGSHRCVETTTIDVLVCSLGKSPMINERLECVRTLKNAQIRAVYNYEDSNSTTELIDRANQLKVPFLAIFNEKQSGQFEVRYYPNNFEVSSWLTFQEMVPYIKKLLKIDEESSLTKSSTGTSAANLPSSHNASQLTSKINVELEGGAELTIECVSNEKLPAHKRKHWETCARRKLAAPESLLSHFRPKSTVCAVVVRF